MTTLIHITPNSDPNRLKEHYTLNPNSYLLFLPNRFTTQPEYDHVHQLVKDLSIPPENYLEINTTSIVQKAWRIIRHYESLSRLKTQDSNMRPGTPDRKSHNAELAQQNRSRIQTLQNHIETMIVEDQAFRFKAKIVTV